MMSVANKTFILSRNFTAYYDGYRYTILLLPINTYYNNH